MKRVNIKQILADPKQRRCLFVRVIQATQAREGITTTYEQALAAYQKIQLEKELSNDTRRTHGRNQ